MSPVEHLVPDGLHHNPAFTNAIVVSGPHRTVYVGGQDAVNEHGEIVGRGDVGAQSRQAIENVRRALAAAGGDLEHVVKWIILLVQGQPLEPGFAAFQEAWGEPTEPTDDHDGLRRRARPPGLPDRDRRGRGGARVSASQHSSLQRPAQPMPDVVRDALEERGLGETYRARPAYQQNDYLGWINSAKRDETKAKRLAQMLDELERGDVYMNMAWRSRS